MFFNNIFHFFEISKILIFEKFLEILEITQIFSSTTRSTTTRMGTTHLPRVPRFQSTLVLIRKHLRYVCTVANALYRPFEHDFHLWKFPVFQTPDFRWLRQSGWPRSPQDELGSFPKMFLTSRAKWCSEKRNNTFATRHTLSEHFNINNNSFTIRVHRGKCVVSTLRAPLLSPGNSKIGQIRISASLGALELPRWAWIFGDIFKKYSKTSK